MADTDGGGLSDLIQSLKATLYERSTSPLLGSFVVFWLLYNWRPLLVLAFSDHDIYMRILEVENQYLDDRASYLYPLGAATAYAILYPYVSVLPYFIWRHANALKTRIRNHVENIVTISREEYVRLRREMHKKDHEFAAALKEKSLREESLERAARDAEERAALSAGAVAAMRSSIGADDDALHIAGVNAVVELRKLVLEGYSSNLAEIARKIPANNQSDIEVGASMCAEWLRTIELRLKNRMLHGLKDEIGTAIRSTISLGERLRNQLTERVANAATLSDHERRLLNSTLEEWEVARTALNSIAETWRRAFPATLVPEGVAGDIHFHQLRRIEASSP